MTFAQTHGVVVDQTGLPLPGAHIEVHRGNEVVASLDTRQDGGFDLPATDATDTVVVSLDAFETMRIAPEAAHRIVLIIARATETTEVVASALTSSGASMEHLGSTISAPLAQRLPTARPRILQSLPLLPAVVRGRDGLLRIGGTRPHESTLWIDGFDVTDPVSGTTGLDLPVESVRGMAVLREPVAATFGDVIGSAASIETAPGGDQFKMGVQGFIPRPRLSRLGFGRIEAFFPRAYASGRAGLVRYFASTEFNFERVPVPGVTGRSGAPNVGTTGVTSFVRVDLQPSTRHILTRRRAVRTHDDDRLRAQHVAPGRYGPQCGCPRSVRRPHRPAGPLVARRADSPPGRGVAPCGAGRPRPRRRRADARWLAPELVLRRRCSGCPLVGDGRVGSCRPDGCGNPHRVRDGGRAPPNDGGHVDRPAHSYLQ